ncbi:MAG: sensor histidine kinase N-terminal domain-containing protein [Burkholderiaceae bacterium]|nr:sensor histidine kinase N-terminal domain-containing protein [Burkholderiaceae bacterium]
MTDRSLRAQLLRWVLVPLLVVAVVDTAVAYFSARGVATAEQDRMLLGSARVIAESLSDQEGQTSPDIPPAALELLRTDSRDLVYYSVATSAGVILAGHSDLPLPRHALAPEQSTAFDAIFLDEPVRVVAFSQPQLQASGSGSILVEVAQTLLSRRAMTLHLWAQSISYQWLMIALAGAMISIGMRLELRPLKRLGERVRQRPVTVHEPLGEEAVPEELQPVIDSFNDYVRRLHDLMAAQGRFIANASHQLRTPLTVLNTQLDYALRGDDAHGRTEALQAMRSTLQHGIRVVSQMLSFCRAEGGVDGSLHGGAADLTDIARQVVEEAALAAVRRNVDLGCELDGPAFVPGSSQLLHELVANLVDNALRYGREGGVVTVGVHGDSGRGRVRLTVEDDGPGICREQRELVFERFYRRPGEMAEGSGLGLSIVREIALASSATVALSDPPSGRGIVVGVDFPAAEAPRAESAREASAAVLR